MSPSNLSLFPSASNSIPRKTSSRRARVDNVSDTTELNLRGVAFQVVTSSRSTAKVQPATDTIKHSLSCESPTSAVGADLAEVPSSCNPTADVSTNDSPNVTPPLRRQSKTRRRSRPISLSQYATQSVDEDTTGDDQLSDLPHNTSFSATTPPRRSMSTQLRSRTPQNLSTMVQPDHIMVPITPVDEKKDRLSPLPEKTKFASPSNNSEYPQGVRSGSPVPSKASQTSEPYTSPMRSIFPIYDPSKPLDRQNYYPSPTASPPPAYLGDNVSKLGSPMERQNLKRFDSVVGLLDGYEHVPPAAHGDMEALWKASCEEYPVAGRKIKFGLYQPNSNGRSLAIGTSHEDLIYCMEKDVSSTETQGPVLSKQFAVKKHCPTARSSLPVSIFSVPDQASGKDKSKSSKEMTAIFPHAAAMHAIEAVLSTPEAAHIATFDPTAQSPQAADLARDAVTEAHRRYHCDLIKRTRKRDSLGSVTAHYELVHPMLGTCPVTVTKSLAAGSIYGPRAKISFHHPSATPAAVAAETLNLAFIDFAHDACVLDVPGLLALDSHYIIDTVISTLLAIAVIENDALVAETMVFEAPPKTPMKSKSKKVERRSSVGSSRMFKRSGTKKNKKEKQVEVVGEQVELGGVAKGVLAIVEFGFKASAWVIVTGVKVGFGVVEYGVEKIQNRIEQGH